MKTYTELLNASEDELFAAIMERDAKIERLQTEMDGQKLKFTETLRTCADTDLEQKQIIAKLFDALRPWAKLAELCEGVNWVPDACPVIADPSAMIGTLPNVGDCRTAAKVVKEVGG